MLRCNLDQETADSEQTSEIQKFKDERFGVRSMGRFGGGVVLPAIALESVKLR